MEEDTLLLFVSVNPGAAQNMFNLFYSKLKHWVLCINVTPRLGTGEELCSVS